MRYPTLGETELLVPLHEGIFEQPMWQTFLSRLRDATGAGFAALLFRTADNDDIVRLISRDEPVPVRFEELFLQDFGSDPSQSRFMRPDRVYSLDELVEAGGEKAARFRAEALGPSGIVTMRSMRIGLDDRFDAWLVIGARKRLGPQVGALMTMLVPHLHVTLRVLDEMERARARSAVSTDALSRLNFGWISIDGMGRVIDMDDAARQMMQRSGALWVGRYDRLVPASPAADRQLTALVRKFASDPRATPRAINLSHDPWIDILVSPIRIDTLARTNKAVAVIYFRGDRISSADRQQQLVDLFDLTPSEARLAWSMTQGKTIAEAAEEQGLTIETARNYSKKIYAKTGARGQVDLVRNILTGVLAIA